MAQEHTAAIKIVNARYSQPANANGGLYVQLQWERGQEESAERYAQEIAGRFGFDGNGQATVGLPVCYGVGSYRTAFWFHDIPGCAADRRAVIDAATLGPLCVYEYPQDDPRRA